MRAEFERLLPLVRPGGFHSQRRSPDAAGGVDSTITGYILRLLNEYTAV